MHITAVSSGAITVRVGCLLQLDKSGGRKCLVGKEEAAEEVEQVAAGNLVEGGALKEHDLGMSVLSG